MKPSSALALHRDDVRRLGERSSARNPRVFGSALQGKDTEASDIDILFDPMPGTRNRMAHGYFDVSLDTMWETVQTSLSDLEEKLRKIDTPRGAWSLRLKLVAGAGFALYLHR
jgi:predicted nucleotidyltransferase